MAAIYWNVLTGVVQVMLLIGNVSTTPPAGRYGFAPITERVRHYDRSNVISHDNAQRGNEPSDVEVVSISNTSRERFLLGVLYCQYQHRLCRCDRSLPLDIDNNTVPINMWTLAEIQGEKQLHSLGDSPHECIASKHEAFLRTCNNVLQSEERKLAGDSLYMGIHSRCNNTSQRHIYICSCFTRSPHSSFRHQHIKTCSVQISYFSSGRFKMLSKTSTYKSMPYVLLPQYCINRNDVIKQNISKEIASIGRPIGFKIIMFVLTTVSSLSVVMTLFVFATFTELRNIHSKVMMSLSLTFLFTQLICIYEVGNHNSESCLVIGALLHYCWLSIFSWTSILAYGLMMIFWTRTPSGVSMSNSNEGYLMYATCSWLGPIPVNLICLVTDHYLPNHIKLYTYNSDLSMCMLSKVTAVYSVVVPMCIYFVINIICLTMILYKVFSQRKCVLKTWPPQDEYVCWQFSKILLLLGIYWTLCLVAMYLESMVAWCIFSIFGNLHNLFICMSFVLVRNNTAMMINRHTNHPRLMSASSCTSNNSNNNYNIALQIVTELEQ